MLVVVEFYVAPDAAQVDGGVADALRERADAGIDVVLAAGDEALVTAFEDDDVFVIDMSDDDMTGFTGRTLLVDDATVLLSVVPGPEDPENDEVAMWTAGTSIGRILGRFVDTGMQAGMERAAIAEETGVRDGVPDDVADEAPDEGADEVPDEGADEVPDEGADEAPDGVPTDGTEDLTGGAPDDEAE
jgi:hypothetical protein